ncbi:hypothetical protein K1F50_07880 [Muricauda oceani]|uniref:Uncharacterized protein n=1 Tax=Flagellimonas oceani TaxID=2698672 RepID=A0A6G7J405_9FLAO|nr:hypothetical protein [Allomuricauda oceani]MBW8242718.1 hypothetical protein [Allomuricauda oceani]QII45545.1 hypothetical protein GVT53_12935 [Allomuricauda oceani]
MVSLQISTYTKKAGSPVGLAQLPGGSLLMSDDSNGKSYDMKGEPLLLDLRFYSGAAPTERPPVI